MDEVDAGSGYGSRVYDVVVPAGGHARRLGGVDKPGLDVGGVSLLDRVLAAVPDARTVVCVGPSRPTVREVLWCLESPPGGGPVVALAAALALLHVRGRAAPMVLVLAADLPRIAPAVPALLDALDGDPDAAAAVLVDVDGRVNHLAAAWRRPALTAALASLGEPAGARVGALTRSVRTVSVTDPDGWGRDCDTWADVEQAQRLAGGTDQNATSPSPA